jgi:hypothetical protein
MGCGCGKNKNKNKQSSRMPASKPKKIGNILVPQNMTPDQRRSTIAKINNEKASTRNKNPREVRKQIKRNIADRMMSERVRKRDCDG